MNAILFIAVSIIIIGLILRVFGITMETVYFPIAYSNAKRFISQADPKNHKHAQQATELVKQASKYIHNEESTLKTNELLEDLKLKFQV